ncbi:lysophospholipid acyltransferase family protein [Agilicoccus flavus]|uniref:lysophospholipid acyltransferase family protein n=1 Tax=Agilicoccus flavus TaxID=2775968 RepID=UPI001CF699D0|nr:lysophospholipid acyltransferase family protein [Agilicoccus flavus]
MEPVYSPVITFARGLFAAEGLRFDVQGVEHVPASGGAVVMMNHLSYLDFAYAGYAALPAKRYIRFMCKDSIFSHPVAGPLMRGMKHIPVDRENGGASFRAALTALKAGELVGVFPEATISRSYELKDFKSGAVRMAQAARVPILPMVLWGSQRVWTKGHPKRLGRTNTPIVIRIGEPIPVARTEKADVALDRVKATMQAMLDDVRRGYPSLSGDELKFVPASMGGTAPTLAEASALDLADAQARRAARGSAADPAEPIAPPPEGS